MKKEVSFVCFITENHFSQMRANKSLKMMMALCVCVLCVQLESQQENDGYFQITTANCPQEAGERSWLNTTAQWRSVSFLSPIDTGQYDETWSNMRETLGCRWHLFFFAFLLFLHNQNIKEAGATNGVNYYKNRKLKVDQIIWFLSFIFYYTVLHLKLTRFFTPLWQLLTFWTHNYK